MILIHGLPKGGPDEPTSAQLRVAESYIRKLGFETIQFDWGSLLDLGFHNTYRLLREGKFVDTFARAFTRWLDTAPEVAKPGIYSLASYSLGGMGFYGWVRHPETPPAALARFELAVSVASPHRFSSGQVEVETPQGRILTMHGLTEAPINPEAVVKTFCGHLRLMFGGKDHTILPADSAFPEDLVKDKSVPFEAIERHVAEDATHRTIVTDEVTAIPLLGQVLSL